MTAVRAPIPPASYADIEALPPEVVGEIFFGDLYTHPRPLPRHALAHMALGAKLSNPFQYDNDGPGGWIFMTEPELHIAGHVAVPDLAGWRQERLPTLPTEAGMTLVPDWACEIISPSTGKYDRTIKRDAYHEMGVTYLWYVEPNYRTLEVYQRAGNGWLLLTSFRDDDEVSADPFAAAPFSLAALWPLDPPEDADQSAPAPTPTEKS